MATTSSGNGPGSRIRAYRIKRGMTQHDLAGDRYSVSYISKIEREKGNPPSRAVLRWCADRLGVSVAELLGESVLKESDGQWVRRELSRHAYEQVYAQMLVTGGEVTEALRRLHALRQDGNAPSAHTLIWFSAYGASLAGEMDDALTEAEAYRQLVDERDTRSIAAYHWLLGHIALASANIDQAHLEFARALEANSDGQGDPDSALAIRRTLAETHRARHDFGQAHQIEAEALRDYERQASLKESANWSRARAETAATAGDYVNAYLLIRWAWNSQREAYLHRHAARLYLRHATYADENMPAEQRESELRRAAMLADLIGDEETRILAGAYLAHLLAKRGAPAVAEEVMRLTVPDASTGGIGGSVDSEQAIALALAHGWMAAADGQEDTARALARDVDTALEQPPAFARTDTQYAGVVLSGLFERLNDHERAFHALKRAMSRR